MTVFCIQVQPDRSPGMDVGRIRELCAGIAADKALVERHGVIEGNDEGPYINLMFESADAPGLWGKLEASLYAEPTVGQAMKDASMTTCTGEEGWDDYLLLYHYDKALPLDSFEAH